MPKISFVRKPAKHGKEDYVFTIPRNYLSSGIIKPELKYKITFEPHVETEKEKAYIIKIISGLDEQLALKKIDQALYYQLIDKYNKELKKLEPEEEEEPPVESEE